MAMGTRTSAFSFPSWSAGFSTRRDRISRAKEISAWTLGLESELLFVGDAGTTTAGRPSGRTGFEVSAYAALGSRGHVDADLAVSRARFPDDAVDDVVPGAARMVASAGLSVDAWGGFDAGLG
jgi:hypothetical protein